MSPKQPTNLDLHNNLKEVMDKLNLIEKRLIRIEGNTMPKPNLGKSAYAKD